MRKLKLPGRDETRPRLNEKDIRLIEELGIKKLKKQARLIAEKKLREQPENDGSQTPGAGNPVYKAMHACHVDSRKNLSRAHKIPAGKELTDSQIESVVNLIVRWIVREHNFYLQEKEERQKKISEF